MAYGKINLRIITPKEVKLDEAADLVIMRASTGEMGVLAGHENRSVLLDYGPVRIIDEGKERQIAVFGGLAQIKENVLSIISPEAQWPEDINRSRVEAERERVEERLLSSVDDLEIQRDQALLRQLLVQIEVAAFKLQDVVDWAED